MLHVIHPPNRVLDGLHYNAVATDSGQCSLEGLVYISGSCRLAIYDKEDVYIDPYVQIYLYQRVSLQFIAMHFHILTAIAGLAVLAKADSTNTTQCVCLPDRRALAVLIRSLHVWQALTTPSPYSVVP
jgi:hypothetical protein